MKKTQLKKLALLFFFLVLIPIIGAIYLGYLDIGSKHNYQENVLDVAFTWGDKPETIQTIFEDYHSSTGIPLVVDTQLRENDVEKLLSSDNPPDVIVLSSSELISTYQATKTLGFLNTALDSQAIDTEDYYSAAIAPCQTASGLICLPWGSDVYALFWNKNLFAAAGLDPERPPQTLSELLVMSEALSVVNPETGEFEQLGFLPDFPRSHLGLYIHLFGGSWPTADHISALGDLSQPILNAIDWEINLVQQHDVDAMNNYYANINYYRNSGHPLFAERRANCQQCHRRTPGNEEKMPDQAFYNQQVAMMIDGQWQESKRYLPYYAPDLNYGVAPMPAAGQKPDLSGSSIVQGPVVIIPAAAKDSAAAAEFVSWLVSSKSMAQSSQMLGFLPSRESAAELISVQAYPHLKVFLSILRHPETVSFPSSKESENINEILIGAEKFTLHEDPSMDTFQTEYLEGIFE